MTRQELLERLNHVRDHMAAGAHKALASLIEDVELDGVLDVQKPCEHDTLGEDQ